MASNTYGAIKLSTAEDVGAVLKKKTGSEDGYKPKEWADTINLMGLLPIRTASGTIAHFSDGADDVPMKSVVANIVPIQSGTGTPSPSNPRPISGTDELMLTRTGANLWNFLTSGQSVYPQGVDEANKTISWRADGDWDKKMIEGLPFKANTQYTFILKLYRDAAVNVGGSYGANMGIKYTDGTTQPFSYICEGQNVFVTFAVTSTANKIIDSLYVFNNGGNTVLKYEESGVFEGVLTTADFEPYNAETYTIDLGQEIMGGTADVVGGTGEETYVKHEFSSSEIISDNYIVLNSSTNVWYWTQNNLTDISDIDSDATHYCNVLKQDANAYNGGVANAFRIISGNRFYITLSADDYPTKADFRNAIDTLKPVMVLKKTTPTDFTFTGQPINSLLGVNNVWTDSGEVLDVEYRADMNLLIAEWGG